jgi:hypothetical protein
VFSLGRLDSREQTQFCNIPQKGSVCTELRFVYAYQTSNTLSEKSKKLTNFGLFGKFQRKTARCVFFTHLAKLTSFKIGRKSSGLGGKRGYHVVSFYASHLVPN